MSPLSKSSFNFRCSQSFQNLFHTTSITIGNPPQHFRLALDINTGDFIIPSATCGGYECDERQEKHPYNSSMSSTYDANGTSATSTWAGYEYDGFLSQDTIHFGNLDLGNLTFEEWTTASCIDPVCINRGYDGVLGLAPPWMGNARAQNVLLLMLAQNILDSPIFSLKLPLYEQDEGEILFGAVNPLLNSSAFVTFPVINSTADGRVNNSWTVPASHVSLDTPVPLELNLPPDAYAVLDTAIPYIMLPSQMARNITAAIGGSPGPYWFHHVPCERRQELPNLLFTLAGHNVTITPFHYILQMENVPTPPDGRPGRICVVPFMPSDEFSHPENGLVLGHPFLRGFYSQWDFGEGEVRCKLSSSSTC